MAARAARAQCAQPDFGTIQTGSNRYGETHVVLGALDAGVQRLERLDVRKLLAQLSQRELPIMRIVAENERPKRRSWHGPRVRAKCSISMKYATPRLRSAGPPCYASRNLEVAL